MPNPLFLLRTQLPSNYQSYLAKPDDNWRGGDQGLLLTPLIVTLLSVGILLSRIGAKYAFKPRGRVDDASNVEEIHPDLSRPIVERNGGRAVFLFMVARAVGCLALVGLSVPRVLESTPSKAWSGQLENIGLEPYQSLLVANAYAFVLACLAITAAVNKRDWLIRHNIAILLTELAVYLYRDLWPFATLNERPRDLAEGWLLWAKIITLVFSGIIIPLCIPRVYSPVNPKDPAANLHPEQTASILSFSFYSHLTPTILAGTKTTHLSVDQLPPMADYDRVDFLVDRSLPHLDPLKIGKGRHIFFGLFRIFAWDYFLSLMWMISYSLSQFAAPIAVNRLLTSLESGQKETVDVRPWFWIACLFVGPLITSVSFHSYSYIISRVESLAKAILTQLIFDYSLQVRVKAENPEKTHTVNSPGEESAGTDTSDAQGISTPTEDNPSKNFIGKLNNLATVDLDNITGARDTIIKLGFVLPSQLIGCSVLLYIILGWSAFIGVATMVALLPVPGYMTKLMRDVQVERMKRTDSRTQTVTESMNVLRMIKLFGWEEKIQERVDQSREEELKFVWKAKVLMALTGAVTFSIPTVIMLATYATATVLVKMELTSAKVFSSMILFDLMRSELSGATYLLNSFVRGKVSIDRLNDFFKDTELLDSCESSKDASSRPSTSNDEIIGFRNASFTWNPEVQSGESASSSQFKLTIPDELWLLKGKINMIVGPTGSGKTSLLMALLGEMYFTPSHPDSMFNLPRADGISLAVQESWVQNATIRENILFHSPYDEHRYKKVLYQCALEPDLDLLEAGDLTEVGERGLTLSGGQKARLTLARAIYSEARIILLDDVLAALDVHTSTWIVNKCLTGDLVQGRTVILVTHNVALASPIASFIVSINHDGVATGRGQDLSAVLLSDPALQSEYKQELTGSEETQDDLIDKPSDKKTISGKLILAEEVQQGSISWKAMKVLINSLGDHPYFFTVVWIVMTVIEFFMHSFRVWFLGYWGSQYEHLPVDEVPVIRNLWTYVALTIFTMTVFIGKDVWFILATMRVSRTIHKILSESILRCTLRWLDETPISRIIARMTQDINSIDGSLVNLIETFANLLLLSLAALISAVIFVPIFTLPGLFVSGIGAYLGSQYMKTQLSVKRELSNAKAPMLAHFAESMAGLISIRAYGAQSTFKKESRKRTDQYVRLNRMIYDLNRWIGIRMELLGNIFTASLAAYLTYVSGNSSADVGFSLNRAVEFCSLILYVVRSFTSIQVEANSLERIVAYTEIEHERKPTGAGKPPASWPTSGDIQVENLAARYSKTGPVILSGLSFHIRSGERIGVVGRTGSGKSSLTLALLRCILTEGTVHFDGLNTNEINLDALRSNITIIPQIPELLSGTLRYNLDPFNEYDDVTLNAALRSSGLRAALHNESGGGRLGLDSNIASGGVNVSVGQRQILALARAIIRSSKLLILDEATSAIDHETDAIIQNTLRRELGSDVTVITIAHRLQTIIDADRIMVLDAGRIVEFASPAELLSKEQGAFKALVDGSGDRSNLYQAAGKNL